MRNDLFLTSIFILFSLNLINCTTNRFLISHDGKVKTVPAEQELTLKLFNLCKPIPDTLLLRDKIKGKPEATANVIQIIYEFVVTEGVLDSSYSYTKQVARSWHCPDSVFKKLGGNQKFSKIEQGRTTILW